MKKKSAIKLLMFVVLGAGGFFAAAYTFDFFAGEPIAPGVATGPGETKIPEPYRSVEVEIREVKEWYEAVGTIRPRTEAKIEAQVMAQVMDVMATPGETVEKDEILVILDSRQLSSRLGQAREGLKSAISGKEQALQSVAAAEAAFDRAESDYRRHQTYYESQAATEQQLEEARSAYLRAEAELKRAREGLKSADAGIGKARQVVREAEIALGYTELRAPEKAEVLKRLADPGDLALPGKPLLLLQTKGGLRLEAYIREGLIGKVKLGDSLPLEIKAVEKKIDAVVEEIVPYADPQTRTFIVKAALPVGAGLYPGMFGKLLIPVQERSAVLVPEEAIRKVGQMEIVKARVEGGWQSRFIKTGKKIGDKIEVLSGLSGKETVAVEEYK